MPGLHEELASVLSEQGNLWMTVTELTRAVNARGQTTRRGDPVMRITVDTRTREMVDVFEREGSRVRLRSFEARRLTPIDVADGGLMSYGPDESERTRGGRARAAATASGRGRDRRRSVVRDPRGDRLARRVDVTRHGLSQAGHTAHDLLRRAMTSSGERPTMVR